jgi:hypothetical protein
VLRPLRGDVFAAVLLAEAGRFRAGEVFRFAVPLRVAEDFTFFVVRFRVADAFLVADAAADLVRPAVAERDLAFGRAGLRCFLTALTAAPETAPRTVPTTGRPTALPATAPATAPPRVLPAVLLTASAPFSSLSWSSMPLSTLEVCCAKRTRKAYPKFRRRKTVSRQRRQTEASIPASPQRLRCGVVEAIQVLLLQADFRRELGVDQHLEAAIDHALGVEGHRFGVHGIRYALVLHHLLEDAVAVGA